MGGQNKMLFESGTNICWKNFFSCKFVHQCLVFMLPFFAVRGNSVAKLFPRCKMGHLVYKSDQESILVKIAIYRDSMSFVSVWPMVVPENTLAAVGDCECDLVISYPA